MERRNFIQKMPLQKPHEMDTLIEHHATFTFNNCELKLFETHQSANNIALYFPDLTFTAMMKGKKQMKINHKTDFFDYQPGESLLMNPGEEMVINFLEADTNPTQCLTLSMNEDFINQTLHYLEAQYPSHITDNLWELSKENYFLLNNQSLTISANNIINIAKSSDLGKDILTDFAVKDLLVRIMQSQRLNLIEQYPIKDNKLSFIIDYIKKNIDKKLSINHLAQKAYISISNFYKLFKSEFGITPNEFILKERIEKAKSLLKQYMTINEIAYLTGFSDSNYFIRTFKQMVGVTPKKYQQTLLIH